MKRVLLTGAAGFAGTAFRRFARGRYRIRCFDRVPVAGERDVVVGNLTDQEAVFRAAKGCDAVVHLAAIRDDADFMTQILPNNIVGTYNVYEAARQAHVRKFVFASTMQVDMGYPREKRLTPDMPPLPTNFYAASKVLGENLGEIYANRFNMSVVCLRFGWIAVRSDAEWEGLLGRVPPWETITERDLNGILCAAVEAKGVGFVILPAFSRNARHRRDLSLLKKALGYYPREDARELHRRGKFFTSRPGPRKRS